MEVYDNGDNAGFRAHGGRAGGLRGFALGSGWIEKSLPSSEIAGRVPVAGGISRRCECIVNMKAIFAHVPDAEYYRDGFWMIGSRETGLSHQIMQEEVLKFR
jgi:hypothetical protein